MPINVSEFNELPAKDLTEVVAESVKLKSFRVGSDDGILNVDKPFKRQR